MHILNIGSGVYGIYLVYMYMDGEYREYSEYSFRKDFCLLVGAPVLHLVLVTQNSFYQLETASVLAWDVCCKND